MKMKTPPLFALFIFFIYFNLQVIGMEINQLEPELSQELSQRLILHSYYKNYMKKGTPKNKTFVDKGMAYYAFPTTKFLNSAENSADLGNDFNKAWYTTLNPKRCAAIAEAFKDVTNANFDQEKFNEICETVNKGYLDNVSDEHLLEYFYAKILGINITHKEVMNVSKALKSQALWTAFWTFLFIELPVLSYWKAEQYCLYPHKKIYEFQLTAMPMAIFTFWSTLLAIPFVLNSNPLLTHEIHLDEFLDPDSHIHDDPKTTKWDLLKLTDLTHELGNGIHMTSIFLKGNQLGRGLVSFIGLSFVTNMLLNSMQDYVGLEHIPPARGIFLFFHRLLLCVKAWALDFFGPSKKWHIANIFGENVDWEQNINNLYGKKLLVDAVLGMSGLVIKFFKAFVIGSTIKLSRQNYSCIRKINKWFQKTFFQKYDPTPGNGFENAKKMINPTMVLLVTAAGFHLTEQILKLVNSPVENDFGDFSCIPAALALLYPVKFLSGIGYSQVVVNAQQNVIFYEAQSPHIAAIQLWIKKNNRILIAFSSYSFFFFLLSYGGIGIGNFDDFANPIAECFWVNLSFYYLLGFGANSVIRLGKMMSQSIKNNESDGPNIENNDLILTSSSYKLSKPTFAITFLIGFIIFLILQFISKQLGAENNHE